MLTMIALAAGLLGEPPTHDPLVPPTRVTTSFTCGKTVRSIIIAHGIGRDAVVAVTLNGKAVVGTPMSQIRSGLAPLDAMLEHI